MATGRVPTTANSPLTAKGDLFTYSTAPARLAVGNSGETIVADSSTSTGLRYTANFAAGKNKIINGDFGIWQRGTSFSTGNTYTADRWTINSNATFTASRQTFTPASAPVSGYEGQFFYRFDKSAGGSFGIVAQRIEDVRTFAGQTVTISFWARVGSGTLTLNPYVDQNFGTGGSATVGNTTDTVTVNTSWTRYTIQYAVPSMSGKTIGTGSFVEFSIGRVITASAYVLDLWGVQVEAGSVATAFQTATGTLQGELAACQRYYQRISKSAYGNIALGQGFGTTRVMYSVPTKVTMRVAPTAIDYSNVMSQWVGVAAYAITAFSLSGDTVPEAISVDATHASGINQGSVYTLGFTSAGGYLGFTAEL